MATITIRSGVNAWLDIQRLAPRIDYSDTVIVSSEKIKQELEKQMKRIGKEHILYFVEVRKY